MEQYAPFLVADDPRIADLFDVEHEAERSRQPLVDDPYPVLAKARAAASVHRANVSELVGVADPAGWVLSVPDRPTFCVLSFDACNRALIENDVFSSSAYWELHVPEFLGDTILNKSGAEHRRYRDPLQPLFKPSHAHGWWKEQFIEQAADILVSHIEQRKGSNLFLDLCARMPFYVTSAAFGVPAEMALDFRLAMEQAASAPTLQGKMEGANTSVRMLDAIVDERRANPRDDIISVFAQAEMEEADGSRRPYTNREIVDHARLIVFAGGGTTWRQMGITLLALLDHPEQLDEVRSDRTLLGPAVLESCRWEATDTVFPRQAACDAVLDGVEIPRGSIVQVVLGAANRDPLRWEDPDRFDVHRPVQRSLTFVSGPHSCLGQHVARQEMETAVGMVLDRLPGLRWDPDEPHPRISGGLNERGPTALPVVWD